MDKEQGYNSFLASASGLSCYEENNIPDGAILPYMTYQGISDSLGSVCFSVCTIWDRSSSWAFLDGKKKEMEEYIGGGRLISIDNGRIFFCKGSPFAQRVKDASDQTVKGWTFNLQIEFLTEY